jgi:hypothetical protein
MKVKVNIREHLTKRCGSEIDIPVTIRIDQVLKVAGIAHEHELDLDIHELLAQEGKIAHIWGIDDVQCIRPDLEDDQAWQVLQDIERRLDSQYGISWDTIEIVADELYGPKPERRWHGRIDVTITDTDGYDPADVSNRLQDLCALLAEDGPDVQAIVETDSIRLADPSDTTSA